MRTRVTRLSRKPNRDCDQQTVEPLRNPRWSNRSTANAFLHMQLLVVHDVVIELPIGGFSVGTSTGPAVQSPRHVSRHVVY